MTDLKPCPCGKIPRKLWVTDSGSTKWALVCGDCCSEWHIEFRTHYESGDKFMTLATEAWNNAPRAKP